MDVISPSRESKRPRSFWRNLHKAKMKNDSIIEIAGLGHDMANTPQPAEPHREQTIMSVISIAAESEEYFSLIALGGVASVENKDVFPIHLRLADSTGNVLGTLQLAKWQANALASLLSSLVNS
jgi:hypothetical protein